MRTYDEHFRMIANSDCYIVVVAIDGALGIKIVQEYRYRYPNVKVSRITGDKYFAGVAIRHHIFDFIVRPITEIRFMKSLRRFIGENKVKGEKYYEKKIT